MYTFPAGNAAWATRAVSIGTGGTLSCGKLISHPSFHSIATLLHRLPLCLVLEFANSIKLTLIDDLRERFSEPVVAEIPVAAPGETRPGHPRRGIRHVGQSQIGRFSQERSKEGFAVFGGLAPTQMGTMPAE